MKTSIKITIWVSMCMLAKIAMGQPKEPSFTWPQTPAAQVYKDFVQAYNTGTLKQMEGFVKRHYTNLDEANVKDNVDRWMDLFYRYGPIEPYKISINKPHDLEIWVQGVISKAWFAPEFILNKKSQKIKAVGILQGNLPKGAIKRSPNEKIMLEKFKSYLVDNEKHGLFQGTVLLQRGDSVLLNKGYGYRNIDTKTRHTPNTRIGIMSITKPITAIACLQLVQQGLLDLKVPIQTYLPELPEHISGKITVEMLLSHTSGYELDGIDGFREALKTAASMEEVYRQQLKYLPKWEYFNNFAPTLKYDYSNDSFDLIAVIIEKITNMKFEDYLKTYIFEVAGMKDTSFKKDGIAHPYRYDISQDGLVDMSINYPFQLARISGAGGINSTTKDLQLLFRTLFNTNDLLDGPHKAMFMAPRAIVNTASNLAEANTPKLMNVQTRITNTYALGLHVSYDGALNIGHGGNGVGNSSDVRYFPDSGYLLIILCNNRSGSRNAYNFFKSHLPVHQE